MPKPVQNAVVVITGASSGIGKATATEFAARGARLMLCARREQELEETAAQCRQAGAEVETMRVDVAEREQVHALAARAIERFGGIDIWINNAGVDVFGSFVDVPEEAIERCIQTNLFGTIHGMKAVLPHFIARGAGILINNASLVGVVPTPFHAAYVASKFAIRGLSHSVRQEVASLPDVHVCTVCPSSIDTPLWQRAANYSGRKVKPLDPVHPVEQVAGVILGLAEHPRREVFAGATGWVLAEQHRAAPEATEAVAARLAPVSLFQDAPAEPTAGSIFDPQDHEGGASGGWMRPDRPGIAVGDLAMVAMAPALVAMPGMYAMQLGWQFVEQVGRQMATLPMFPTGTRKPERH
jgi:short-subunit dehydrogenase